MIKLTLGFDLLKIVDRIAIDIANLWSPAVVNSISPYFNMIGLGLYIFIEFAYSSTLIPTFFRFRIVKWILFDSFTLWLAILVIVIDYKCFGKFEAAIRMAIVIKVSVQLLKSN